MKIYLVRHGETTSNQNKLISGRVDNPDLTEKGILQIIERIEKIGDKFDVFACADLKRSTQSIQLFSPKNIILIDDLAERDFGVFEGIPDYLWAKTVDKEAQMKYFGKELSPEEFFDARFGVSKEIKEEIEKIKPEIKWKDDKKEGYFDIGANFETPFQAGERYLRTLLEICQKFEDKDILIISHTALIRALLVILGVDKAGGRTASEVKNATALGFEYENNKFNFIKFCE